MKFLYFFIILFVSVLLYYFLGSYYENETDIFFLVYAKGLLIPKPLALPETFILQIFIGDAIAFLYTHFPFFEWYDSLTLSFTFFIGAFLFNIFQSLKKFLYHDAMLRITVLFFFIAIFVSVALLPEITRHSFLIIILVFVVFLLKLLHHQKISTLFFISCYLAFLVSCLRRPEPAIALTFLFTAFLLLLFFEGRVDMNRAVKIILPCLFILFFLYVYTHVPRTPEGHRYLGIVPYENTLVDFKGELSDVRLLTKTDTIKYLAASHFFFTDTKHLNQVFFQKIGIVPLDKSPGYFFKYITRLPIVKDRAIKLVNDICRNENGLFLLLVVINILWPFYSRKRSPKSILGKLLFSGVFWGTFLFANLFMKVETKVNESLLLFLIVMLLVCLIDPQLTRISKRLSFVVSTAIIVCVLWRGLGFFQLYQIKKNDAGYMDKVRATINDFTNSLVVLNISCWDNISIRLFDNDTYNPNNTYISFDNGVLYIFDEYNSYMKRVTGSLEFIDQVDYVARQPNARWFSSEKRMKMIVNYINAVYRKNYSYTLLKAIERDENSDYNTQAIGIYKINEKGLFKLKN
ncbi:MAG: hypothetical protein V4615_13650 [Bacteroidota bacterium]